MIFTTLALLQLGNALAIRSERQSFFTLGPNTNKPLLWTVIVTAADPDRSSSTGSRSQRLLHTEALSAAELGIVLVVSTGVFWAVEFEKLVRRLASARRVSQPT